MNPDDLIKTAPALAKGAAAFGAAIPFTAIAKRMLGPAADEVAEMWRDHVRLYRYERQLSCLKKAEKMAGDAGFTPTAVPIKVLFPLLEGASFEEDEDIHTMWAALLANAANPEFCMKVRPGFVAALKQLSADEAALLSWFYTEMKRRQSANPGMSIELTFAEVVNGYKMFFKSLSPAPDSMFVFRSSKQLASLANWTTISTMNIGEGTFRRFGERPSTTPVVLQRGEAH